MSSSQTTAAADITVENIGGIDEQSITLDPGVTILAGQNATNRTSFLKALMGVIGSDAVTLKADADEGYVELEYEGTTYTRRLTRKGDHVSINGDPYLDDPSLANLFSFLLESNDCRDAVRRGADLRELITRPIDTAEIEARIRSLQQERREIERELSSLESLEADLPDLEEERNRLKDAIAETEAEIEETAAALDETDTEIEAAREENAELDEKLTALEDARATRGRIRRNRQAEEESIAALESELEEQRAKLEDLEAGSDGRVQELRERIDHTRGRIEEIDRTVTEIQSIIRFNDDFLSDSNTSLVEQLDTDSSSGDITDELVADGDQTVCWTCGTDVSTNQIEETLESLRSLRSEKMQERQDLESTVDELESELSTLEAERSTYRDLESAIERNERELEDRRDSLESLTERADELDDELENLEAAVEDLQRADHSEIFELQGRLNRLEYELEDQESQLDRVESEIDSIESRLADSDSLEDRKAEITEEITELRTRVSRLQSEAVEEFNDHMDTVLDHLAYENLERIWIEHVEGGDGVADGRFELHVVRSSESGSVFEDTVANLSESEREVTGLVFALAGYLAHDVYEEVPFMLLDSIEAIDPERIAGLVEYLDGYADHLVIALLEDDAEAVATEYPQVTMS